MYTLLAVFAIAMGFLEGIVVVYLRQILYPNGFGFPLKMITPGMLSVEWIREIATLLMLFSVAWLSGKNRLQRISFFLFVFAVWDIFYYVTLKLFTNWPESWLTWDILFLIPVPWIGPVLAPLIFSFYLILVSFQFTWLQANGKKVIFKITDLLIFLSGVAIVLFSFVGTYLEIILKSCSADAGSPASDVQFCNAITAYVPEQYDWYLFIVGEMLIIIAVFSIVKRAYSQR